MEVIAAYKMVDDLVKCSDRVFLQNIIMDDDATTMKAVGHWVADGGKMDPKLHKHLVNKFADPTHRTRSINTHVYNIASRKHAIIKGSRLTNYWEARFRRGLSYYIQTHRALSSPSDLIFKNRFAPIEHIFGNHRFCTGQCPGKKRALE